MDDLGHGFVRRFAYPNRLSGSPSNRDIDDPFEASRYRWKPVWRQPFFPRVLPHLKMLPKVWKHFLSILISPTAWIPVDRQDVDAAY
jgi:hypothetical protein